MPGDSTYAEPRWPVLAAVVVISALTVLLPDDLRMGPRWVLPVIEGALVITLVLLDPGRISRESSLLRWLSISLVSLLALSAIWSTARLVAELTSGGASTGSASELLRNGGTVWASTVVAFALIYFELDSGGSAARAHRRPEHPDLAFPQQLNPGIAPPEWRPRFGDYLYLALTNATAFSPTDVMPLAPWAKSAMAVQSLVSLVILALVVARAVNVIS
ncbi:MAG: hypothetical protein QOK15_1256 [Nocardioidaceae bacterium]|nr:hypothetical protein [Nocardioidaceae bacterium]